MDDRPWVRILPEADRHTFLVELAETLSAAQDRDTLAPVRQLVTEWRHTAEVHADPALLAALTSARSRSRPRHDSGARRELCLMYAGTGHPKVTD